MVTKSKLKGFTIVELLIVIVVIGILAAITIVSYAGVTNRANTASNQANANAVIKAAEAVYADTGSYPAVGASSAATITNLSASVAKVPSSITISPSGPPSATNYSMIWYMVATGTNAGQGICVGYWNQVTGAGVTLYSGKAATSTFGSACS